MNKFNLQEQIEDAREGLRKTRESCPYLFPEYCYMRQCEVALKEAKKEFKKAKKRWDNLGK